ncbi:hypothetical protein LINPERHAP2_LOCUS888 [Linum perenne]
MGSILSCRLQGVRGATQAPFDSEHHARPRVSVYHSRDQPGSHGAMDISMRTFHCSYARFKVSTTRKGFLDMSISVLDQPTCCIILHGVCIREWES